MIEIYGTLGPCCSDRNTLENMFREGMTGIRLNLSHGSLEDSRKMIDAYQAAAKQAEVVPQLLIDMQGPELRIGTFASFELKAEEQVTLGPDGRIPLSAVISDQLEAGDHILLDDGRIEAELLERNGSEWSVSVVRGGMLSSRKSIKAIGKNIYGPVVTEDDRRNLADAGKYGVTAIMQPFVRNAQDLRQLREVMNECGAGDLRIFAKIENMEGVQHIDEIAEEADMIVIARGDLGNDMPLWQLPRIQKLLEEACLKKNCPFMVVTQMLASMTENPVPTRAEVSDIFNAAADGASAVMVTNETAAGKYPVEVIRYLCRTAAEGEAYRVQEDR